jgi:hypothetical protein
MLMAKKAAMNDKGNCKIDRVDDQQTLVSGHEMSNEDRRRYQKPPG